MFVFVLLTKYLAKCLGKVSIPSLSLIIGNALRSSCKAKKLAPGEINFSYNCNSVSNSNPFFFADFFTIDLNMCFTMDPDWVSTSFKNGITLFILNLPMSPAYTPCMIALATLSVNAVLPNLRLKNCSTVSS